MSLPFRLWMATVCCVSVSWARLCSTPGDDCSHTACCAEEGHQCYKKDDFYAACRPSCEPGLHVLHGAAFLQNNNHWSCEVITVSHQDCADDDGDCIYLGCCKTTGHKCFMKNPGEAYCKASSPAGWLGHEIRPRGDALQPDKSNAINETSSREGDASQQEMTSGEPPDHTSQEPETQGERQGTTPGSADDGASQQWNHGLDAAHYWNCNGQSCDATHLQPWDASRYVSPPEYAPTNPEAHGGSKYGEKLWMTGAVSDAVSKFLGPDANGCGSDTGGGGGCGKCMLIKNHDAEQDWTAVIMKKHRCHPWNPGCGDGGLHLHLAVPGFDRLEVGAANVCGKAGTTLSKEQSSICGGREPRSCNCSVIPANTPAQRQMRAGCELFHAWGWRSNNPALEWRTVECPSKFIEQVRLGSAFGPRGPITVTFDEVEGSSTKAHMQPKGSEKSGSPRPLLDSRRWMLPAVGAAVASATLLALLLVAIRSHKQSPKHGLQLLVE